MQPTAVNLLDRLSVDLLEFFVDLREQAVGLPVGALVSVRVCG